MISVCLIRVVQKSSCTILYSFYFDFKCLLIYHMHYSMLVKVRYTGSWKPFHDPQKITFDSIKTTHYVRIDKS